jgi:DNA-binding transcriptional MocR family regulator
VAAQYRIEGGTATAIAGSVEKGVRGGELAPGAALPPVRALAERLGVAPATVAAAYSQLRRRGIIATAGRNGTRVRSTTPIAALRSVRNLKVPENLRNLASGEPDPALLPQQSKVIYSRAGALPELLDHVRAELSILPTTSFTVVNGALDAMDRVLQAHLRPGDRVAVEDPGWAACLDLLAMQGLVPVPMPVDDFGPTVEGVKAALARGVRAVIVTTRAQNPTGASVDAKRAKALRPLLREVLVIEDDHAAELSGVGLHPVAGVSPHWAFIRSASKPYGPDLRCAVLAGDPETVSRVEGRMRLTSGWVSTILQRTLLDIFKNFDVVPAGQAYDERRTALVQALAERGVVAHGRTGINVWVPVPDETRAVTHLRDSGYAVAPGHMFRQASPPGIRITTATLSPSEVDGLADAIAEVAGEGLRAVPRAAI